MKVRSKTGFFFRFIGQIQRIYAKEVMISVYLCYNRSAIAMQAGETGQDRKIAALNRACLCGGFLKTMNEDTKWMKMALKEAEKAAKIDEVPVGCILVRDGKAIARGHNTREKEHFVAADAEINAIRKAEKKVGDWQLNDCVLYVTLEPCPMCAWAILQARIKTVFFGSYDTKYGAFGSAIDLRNFSDVKSKVFGGILEEKCD